MSSQGTRIALHVGIVTLCLVPLLGLVSGALSDQLGANPVEKVTHVTGDWALRLLLVTLAITPLRKLMGWRRIALYRRTLGLAAFGYAFLHLLTYLSFDLGFAFDLLGEDIAERPYITLGFAAFCTLVPLAATSTRRAIRTLGRRWVSLHRLVYAGALLAALHYFWLVKADQRDPLIYAGVLAALLAARAVPAAQRSLRARREQREQDDSLAGSRRSVAQEPALPARPSAR